MARAVQRTGRLVNWHDDRGFGFIVPGDGGENVFLHISAIRPKGVRPSDGQTIRYTDEIGPKGTPVAAWAKVEGLSTFIRGEGRDPGRLSRSANLGVNIPLIGILVSLLALGYLYERLPLWVIILYVGLSVVGFVHFAIDKRASIEGAWRVPDRTHLVLAAVGAWPGQALAQMILKHKSSKTSFLTLFWLMALLNLALLVALLWWNPWPATVVRLPGQ